MIDRSLVRDALGICIRGMVALRDITFWWIDRVAMTGIRGETNKDTILVVRLDNIGDFVLWLGAARMLRVHFRDRKMLLIANELFREAAERCGLFDDVVSVNVRRLRRDIVYRWYVVRMIRRLQADQIINPTISRVFLNDDSVVRATGAVRRVGSQGDLSNARGWHRRITNRWYTELIRLPERHLSELEGNHDFIQRLGVRVARPKVGTIEKVVRLGKSFDFEKDYCILFPGASWSGRRWPTKAFAACLEEVYKKYSWHCVLCGTTEERGICQSVIDRAKVGECCTNLAGHTTLLELIEVVRGAKVLIGNETSAIHIAAAVGTPSVCLLGGGHFGRFVPYPDVVEGLKPVPVFHKMPCYGCNWQCTQDYQIGQSVPCIQRIQVEAVIDGVGEALRQNSQDCGVQCVNDTH